MTLLTDEQIREEQRKHQLDSAVQIRGIEVGTHAQLAEVIKDLRERAFVFTMNTELTQREVNMVTGALDSVRIQYQAELDTRKED